MELKVKRRTTLAADFSRTVTVHRIVVRHEDVYGGGETYNTSDFRLQAGDSPGGQWRDIVEPVKENIDDVSEFTFASFK